MAIPAIVAAIAGALVIAYQTDAGKHVINRVVQSYAPDIEAWAMAHAFKKIGLDMDAEAGISKQGITAAINAGPLAGTGLELSDVFDREAVKRDLHRAVLKKVAEEMGVAIGGLAADKIIEALRNHVGGIVRAQLVAGGGNIVDAAKPLAEVVQLIDAANASTPGGVPPGGHPGKEKPIDFSEKGVSNRERQARYRANHTRHWEAR